MAISFETVTGNQTSANVLAQINNNFAKIKDGSVSKADYATNADTVDSKHASDLIPGAATFLNTITSLANLSVGRYFCTQTRQSWEPVTTTGSRTFLIEVSLNIPNSLKSYKITYIAGAGAGESFYSDYNGGSLNWNKIVNNNNILTFSELKNTYDINDNAGRIRVYDDLLIYNTEKELIKDGFISLEDGTGRYIKISASAAYTGQTTTSGCSTYYIYKIIVSISFYNSDYSLIKTVSNTTSYQTYQNYGNDTTKISAYVIGYQINKDTGDILIATSGKYDTSVYTKQGFNYYSSTTDTIIFAEHYQYFYAINYDSSSSYTLIWPNYWYNNHYGWFTRGSTSSSSSAYRYIQNNYVTLNDDRNAVTSTPNTAYRNVVTDAYNWNLIGQHDNYCFFITKNSDYIQSSSSVSLVKFDFANNASNSVSITITGATSSLYIYQIGQGYIENDILYLNIYEGNGTNASRSRIYTYNLNLGFLRKSPVQQGSSGYYIYPVGDFILAFYPSTSSSSTYDTSYCFKKSDLSLVSSYNRNFYQSTGGSNLLNFFSTKMTWRKNSGYTKPQMNFVPIGNYALSYNSVAFYEGGTSYSLQPIIIVETGQILGYFANKLLYNNSSTYDLYFIEDIGLCFQNKKLNIDKVEKLIKSFATN